MASLRLINRLQSEDLDSAEKAAEEVANIATRGEFATGELRRAGAVVALASCLVKEHTQLQASVSHALCNMCIYGTARSEVVMSGCVPHIVHLLSDSESPALQEVQLQATHCVRNLTIDKKHGRAITSAGGVPLLALILAKKRPALPPAVTSLANLSLIPENCRKIRIRGALASCVQLLTLEDIAEDVLCDAVAVVARCAAVDEESAQVVLDKQVIDTWHAFVKDEKRWKLQAATVAGIGRLVKAEVALLSEVLQEGDLLASIMMCLCSFRAGVVQATGKTLHDFIEAGQGSMLLSMDLLMAVFGLLDNPLPVLQHTGRSLLDALQHDCGLEVAADLMRDSTIDFVISKLQGPPEAPHTMAAAELLATTLPQCCTHTFGNKNLPKEEVDVLLHDFRTREGKEIGLTEGATRTLLQQHNIAADPVELHAAVRKAQFPGRLEFHELTNVLGWGRRAFALKWPDIVVALTQLCDRLKEDVGKTRPTLNSLVAGDVLESLWNITWISDAAERMREDDFTLKSVEPMMMQRGCAVGHVGVWLCDFLKAPLVPAVPPPSPAAEEEEVPIVEAVPDILPSGRVRPTPKPSNPVVRTGADLAKISTISKRVMVVLENIAHTFAARGYSATTAEDVSSAHEACTALVSTLGTLLEEYAKHGGRVVRKRFLQNLTSAIEDGFQQIADADGHASFTVLTEVDEAIEAIELLLKRKDERKNEGNQGDYVRRVVELRGRIGTKLEEVADVCACQLFAARTDDARTSALTSVEAHMTTLGEKMALLEASVVDEEHAALRTALDALRASIGTVAGAVEVGVVEGKPPDPMSLLGLDDAIEEVARLISSCTPKEDEVEQEVVLVKKAQVSRLPSSGKVAFGSDVRVTPSNTSRSPDAEADPSTLAQADGPGSVSMLDLPACGEGGEEGAPSRVGRAARRDAAATMGHGDRVVDMDGIYVPDIVYRRNADREQACSVYSVAFLDGSSRKLRAPDDVTGYELLAIVCEKIGLSLEAARYFQWCLQFERYDRWLIMGAPVGLQYGEDGEGRPVTLKQRILKAVRLQKHLGSGRVLVQHKDRKAVALMYAQAKQQFTSETKFPPCTSGDAIRLIGLDLQAQYGDNDPANHHSTFLDTVGQHLFFPGELVSLEPSSHLRDLEDAMRRWQDRVFACHRRNRSKNVTKSGVEYQAYFLKLATGSSTVFSVQESAGDDDEQDACLAVHESGWVLWVAKDYPSMLASMPTMRTGEYGNLTTWNWDGQRAFTFGVGDGPLICLTTLTVEEGFAMQSLLVDHARMYFAQLGVACPFAHARIEHHALPLALYHPKPRELQKIDVHASRLNLWARILFKMVKEEFSGGAHTAALLAMEDVVGQMNLALDKHERLDTIILTERVIRHEDAIKLLFRSLKEAGTHVPSGTFTDDLKVATLRFCDVSLVPTDLALLSSVNVSSCTPLTRVDLANCNLQDEGWAALSECLESLVSLEDISLEGNVANPTNLAAFVRKIAQVKINLKSLNMAKTSANDDVMRVIAEYIAKPPHLPHSELAVLNLAENKNISVKSLKEFVSAASGNAFLLDVNLSYIPAVSKVAGELVRTSSITHVRLRGVSLRSQLPEIVAVMQQSDRVVCLDVHSCSLGKKGAASVCGAVTSTIKRLDIGGNAFDANALLCLQEALPKENALEDLGLSASVLKGSLSVFFAWMGGTVGGLRTLDLSYSKLPDTAVELLCVAARELKQLECVDISQKNGKIGMAFDRLSVMLSTHTVTWRELRANGCGLAASSPVELGEALRKSNTLRVLELRDNKLKGAYGRTLLEHLKGSCPLADVVDLRGNPLAKDTALASGLRVMCRRVVCE